MTKAGETARLEVAGLTRSFPGVLANEDVGFSVAPGSIHALLGENGAGKSTLVKMIYGILSPDAGGMRLDGRPLRPASPKEARALGIAMVFQHFSLFEAMTVLENIALGLDGVLPPAALEARIRAVMERYGLRLDPHRTVATLGVGERQRIEIVRALLLTPRLLIMDEPTSVLTPPEVARLFDTLRALAAGGCSILYISHKLNEIVELCDRATILRGGRVVAECDPRRESPRSMAEMMIGGALMEIGKSGGRSFGAERLAVAGLSLPAAGDFGIPLRDISFSVRAGEIFGIAGVAGNGQNELLLALSGERPALRQEAIRIDGLPVGTRGAEARRRKGLCAVPEERNGHGAVPVFSLADNAVLTARSRRKMVKAGIINGRRARHYTEEVIDGFSVRATGAKSPAGALSGGNLQKFIMGREIMQAPGIFVVSQPTWGVDAGAAAAIRQKIVDLAARGSAVVVISQDLDELLLLSDTLAVMNGGRLSRSLHAGEAGIEEIGLLMGGVQGDLSDGLESQGRAGSGTGSGETSDAA